MNAITRVGFIGLGAMGSGMAMNLRKAGYELLVYDLRKASAQPLLDACNAQIAGMGPGLQALGAIETVTFVSAGTCAMPKTSTRNDSAPVHGTPANSSARPTASCSGRKIGGRGCVPGYAAVPALPRPGSSPSLK